MPAYRADRLEEVFSAIATMAPREQIVRTLATKWGIRARTVRRYVAEADRILAAQAADPRSLEERREHLVQSAILIFRKQMAAGHLSTAQKTLDMMARWHGIGTPQLTTAVHLHAPNGIMTSQAAIAEQVRFLEAEQERRVQDLAKQIAGELTAGNTDDDQGGDGGDGIH